MKRVFPLIWLLVTALVSQAVGLGHGPGTLVRTGAHTKLVQQQPTPLQSSQQQAAAQPSPTPDPNDPIFRIRNEGLNHSQVLSTASYLTDVIGPRLTGSPNMKRANEWTRDQLTKWGLQSAHLEEWGPFGRSWVLKDFSAEVVAPQTIPLIAYPKAWSPSVNIPSATLVYVDAKNENDLQRFKGQLRGKIVLTDLVHNVSAQFEPRGSRLSEKDLLRLANAPDPNSPEAENEFAGPGLQSLIKSKIFALNKLKFFTDEGAALLIEASQGDAGTLFVDGAELAHNLDLTSPIATIRSAFLPAVNSYNSSAAAVLPQLVLAVEQYNRIVRMIQAGDAVQLKVKLETQFSDSDLMGYNTIAEIPGSDKADELVMVGGHMDSWHSGTGATDNGAGVAVAMEAVRILQALSLKPRRTIRIGLWSGEEQGLFGSQAYVAKHFGKTEDSPDASFIRLIAGGTASKISRGPEYDKLSAYYNLDNGTGKIRGIYLQGNEAARSIFREWLAPFKDLGASTITISNTGATDHVAFDAIGLPGFQFIQDEIEYGSLTHHSSEDVFDRLQGDDLKQAATIMAAFLYNTAMRDEKLPRKTLPTS